MSKPLNQTLYNKIKAKAKLKFKSFPSLYASSWISREYIKEGGKYDKPKKDIVSKQSQWYKEKWVQLIPYLKNNKIIDCGSNNKTTKACRPLFKLNKNTPITIDELIKIHGKNKLIEIATLKNKNMNKTMNWKTGKFY